MSALARYYNSLGSIISGSDKEASAITDDLKKEGIKEIWISHNTENIKKTNPDIVIYSTAINLNNEEIIWAKENNKQILHRSDLLELATRSKKLISVSGTHGKTTTSAMISEMLIKNDFEPSFILGGILLSKNTNTAIGNGEYFVIEADESDKSFLKGNPEIAVITNIEAEHMENYPGGIEEIKSSFIEYGEMAILNTGLVVCMEDKITQEIVLNNFNLKDPKLITYSSNISNHETTFSANYNNTKELWDIYLRQEYFISLKLELPGKHNLLNSLAAIGVGYLLGIKKENIKKALENYAGVKRRFQILSKTNDITIIDDYAHHPTEILATIKAAKELKPNRMIVILQPHQPTRLRDLWQSFIDILKDQEELIFITDLYLARGAHIKGITSKRLVEELQKPNIQYIPGNIDQITQYVEKIIKPKDLILIMGAGDITQLGPRLLKSYEVLASN